MNIDDLTLKAYLQQKGIGEIEETSPDILRAYGHTPESAQRTEQLYVTLNAKYPDSKFLALIVEWLSDLEFERVEIKMLLPYRPAIGEKLTGLENRSEARHVCKIEAQDSLRGNSTIVIEVFPRYVMFNWFE